MTYLGNKLERKKFLSVLKNESTKSGNIILCWEELITNYHSPNRYYHNFKHIKTILNELSQIKHVLSDYRAVQIAAYYHDVVYVPTCTDNEEQSVVLMQAHLSYLNYDKQTIEKCNRLVLSTKKHLMSDDVDCNYLIDADLSILGSNINTYKKYRNSIRIEYGHMDSSSFAEGRLSFINSVLSQSSIFITEYFKNRYESQALINLQNEIKEIQLGTV